jgi:hypothetical protein
MQSALFEPSVTQKYFKEYLDKVKYYDNIQRKAVFIRYFNINKPTSTFNDDTKGTFDHYNSGVAYDLYDYTPCFSFTAITNTSTDKTDMGGLVFDGLGDLVIYTIPSPAMGDLISLAYGPAEDNEEILRVIQIDTSVYGKNYGVNFCRLTLEYAPIKDLSKLNIVNRFAYLMTEERNVTQEVYFNTVKLTENNNNYLNSIQTFFSEKYELYYYIYNGTRIAPLEINKHIYDSLCYESKLNRYFDKYKKPFGIKDYMGVITRTGLNLEVNLPVPLDENNLPYQTNITSDLTLLSYVITRPNI